jgi:hypothetical protein
MASITGYTAEEIDKRAKGLIGSAEAQHVGNIGVALVDLLNTAVTFTAEEGRKFKISWAACFQGSAASPPLVTCGVYDGGNNEIRALKKTMAANTAYTTLSGVVIVSPAAGSVTYKLRAQSSVANIVAAAIHTIVVEDVGAA